jgi:hypothetical protein
MQVRHLNGCKTDNRAENLAYGTPKDDADDRRRHGTQARGRRQGHAKLCDSKVKVARRLSLCRGVTKTGLAKLFGVTKSAIGMAIKGDTWRHIAEDRDLPPGFTPG